MILIVDDNSTPTQVIGDVITARLGFAVRVVESVAEFVADPAVLDGVRLALVDLSFRNTTASGLDVLVSLRAMAPEVTAALYTQGDDSVADLIAVCFHAIPLGAVLSKSLPLNALVQRIDDLMVTGRCEPDPVLTPILPSERSPLRSAEAYGRLVPHAGHAKLWRALQRSSPEVSIGELAGISGLAVNSIRNYRESVMAELHLHELERPSLYAMRAFAIRCRPLLEPFVSMKLDR